MSFKREQDSLAKRNQRLIGNFAGVNYNSGYADSNDAYANVCDFNMETGRLVLRDGCMKTGSTGWDGDIEHMSPFNLFTKRLMVVVQNGILSLHKAEDVVTGLRRYYTWGEVYDEFSWQEMSEITWRDLLTARSQI